MNNDAFRINEQGHLVEAIWPTFEDEARVTFGPSDGVIRRIRNANRPATPAVGIFGR